MEVSAEATLQRDRSATKASDIAQGFIVAVRAAQAQKTARLLSNTLLQAANENVANAERTRETVESQVKVKQERMNALQVELEYVSVLLY